MTTLQDVMTALRNADAAGDVQAAQRLAQIASQMSAGAPAPQPPQEESVGLLRRAADVPVGIAQGTVMGFRMLADVFGANNPVSRSIRGAEDYLGELASAQAQGNMQRMSEILEEADGKGVLDQIKIGLQAASEAPVELISQAFGTTIPTILAALSGKVVATGAALSRGATGLQAARAGTAGMVGAQTVAGTGMGMGIIKSEVYDTVFDELSKTMPEDQAREAADFAQSYVGPNTDMIALGGILGLIGSRFGVEPAVLRAIQNRAGASIAQIGGRALASGASEMATEFPQGFQERVAQNLALQRIGVDVPTFEGAVAAGTVEGVAGLGAGAATGAASGIGRQEAPPAEPEVETIPPAPEDFPPIPPTAPIPPAAPSAAPPAAPPVAPAVTPGVAPAAPAPAAAQVETFPPTQPITLEDVMATGVQMPAGLLPFVRREIIGRTRGDLQSLVDARPELVQSDSPTARVIRSLLQPVAAPDQLGVGLPVQQPAGAAPGIAAPEPGTVDGTGVAAQPPVLPETTIPTAVTETPSGLTPPQAVETETQRPQATPGEIILQNRNRSTPASITQMQEIAANPDYGRLGFSRDFANGAPVVFGGLIPESQIGIEDTATATDGTRIPVRYAVMDANEVLASNRADGGVNQEYATATDRTRAIAGNGRVAGIQAAYQRGTAENYINDLKADTRLHGIDPAVVDQINNPVLVRVMPEQFVTPNIGDISNIPTGLELSPTEKARNDQQRVDLGALQFAEDGSITPNTVMQFVRGMPQTEQGGLINPDGRPSSQAYDRLRNAIFARAYNDDQLIEMYAQTEDAEARNILSALAQVAAKMARLEGAGDFDIRNIVTDAAKIAVNARRSGVPLARVAQQVDIAADPDVKVVLDLFAENNRRVKVVVERLGNLADRAFEEFTKPAEDFFGEVPRRTREEIMGELRSEDEQARQRAMEEQDRGRTPQEDDVRQTPEPTGEEVAPTTPGQELTLTPPSAETQAEAERRAAEAESEQEREQIRRESEAGAGQFRLEGEEGRQVISGDLFSEPDTQISPEAQKQQALDAFETTLGTTAPRFRAIRARGASILSPKALTPAQIRLLRELASDAIDAGMPASLLGRVRASGSTNSGSVASMSESGYFLLNKDWAGTNRAEKFHTLIHELGHAADSMLDRPSGRADWGRATNELRQWYDATPATVKHPLNYPFAPRFKNRVRLNNETFAQAFALYFTDPVALQSNAPIAYAQIQSVIERIQNESQPASEAGPEATGVDPVQVQPQRTQDGAAVQPAAGEVSARVSRAQRRQDRDIGQIDQAPVEDIVTEMMESPNIETEPGEHKRKNIFLDSVEATWQTPADRRPLGISDHMIYLWQNKNIDLKRIQDAISNMAYNTDAYMRETLYHGRTAKRIQKFMNNDMAKIVADMKKNNISQKQLGEFLHNRHAPEANRHIAQRNSLFPDGGSGIDTQDAINYMNNLDPKRKKQFEEVATRIDKTIRDMQDMLVETGQESPETIQTWRENFQHYIPLVREDADYSVNKMMSQGSGYAVSGKFTKARTGSTKEVKHEELLAAIAEQHERAILRAESNRVGNALYAMAVTNPNPDFWMALDPETNPVWQNLQEIAQLEQDRQLLQEIIDSGNVDPATAASYNMEIDLINKMIERARRPARNAELRARDELEAFGLDPDLVNNIMMPPMKARYDAKNNEVVYEPNAALNNNHIFITRVDGKDKYVLFNANNERASRMVQSIKKMDAENMGQALNIAAKITRYFAAINTQYNPVFGVYNFLRDVQAGMLQLTDTPIAGKQAQVLKNTAPAIRAIFQQVRAQRRGQVLSDTDREFLGLWEEFTDRGGQTGFRDMFSTRADRAESIQRLIDPASWADSPMGNFFTANGTLKVPFETMRRGAAPVFDLLSDYNTSLENAVRLAAYKVAKDQFISEGMSQQEAMDRAAVIGKELTVNFNRKGALTNQMGALYAFFNAAVQGTTRMAQALTGPAGRTIIGGAFLFGALQAVMLEAAGFDDEEPPEFVKQRNYVIPIGDGQYLAFPMPLGFNVLPTISRIATEAVLSGGEDLPGKAVNMLDAVLDMYNPIGNAGLSMQTLAPTLLDPAVAIIENKDWTGKKIAREDFSSLDPSPGFTRSKDSATLISREVARFLNYATGGTDARRGVVSPTGDQLDYLVGQLTGGVGREAMKLSRTIEAQITGEELPFYSVPLFGRFYGDVNEMAAISSAFYRHLTDLNIHRREIENRAGDSAAIREYIERNPEARMSQVAGTQYREVQKLRKARQELLDRGERERAKRLEEQIKTRMERFNERYRDIRG